VVFSFQYKKEARVDKLDELILQDTCKYNLKKIGFAVMRQG
jgi:hypothetical protein